MEARLKMITECPDCPAHTFDDCSDAYCKLDEGQRCTGWQQPPDWCTLRNSPVMLTLRVDTAKMLEGMQIAEGE